MWRSKRPGRRRTTSRQETPKTAVLLVERAALDVSDALVLERALEAAIESASRVILDLAKVDRINSAIVAMLILEQRRARRLGKALELVGLADPAKTVLRVCHADDLFETHETLEAALERDINADKDDETRVAPPVVITAQLRSALT